MKRALHICAGAALAAALPLSAHAAPSELHISSKGEFTATNVSVLQKAGSTLFARVTWENTFIRIVVTTGTSTVVTKNYGEASSVAEIEPGHVLEVQGKLNVSGDTVSVTALKIRDMNLVKELKSFSGPIKSINASSQTFTLTDKKEGDVSVVVLNATPITQGKRSITFADLKVGDRVVSMSGTYDFATKVLSPNSVEMFQAKDIFVKKNFQGTLKSISSTSQPAQLVVAVDGVEYTVYVSEKASVLNKNKAPTNLRRFAEGDTVRFYGGIRETNLREIDAEVVRDLNF